MKGFSRVLLLVGAAIGISVGVSWTLTQTHGHPAHVRQGELTEVKTDIREIRTNQAELLKLILEQVQKIHANTRNNAD
jgi:hypothetical protein